MAELNSNYRNLEIAKIRHYLNGSLIVVTEPENIASNLLYGFQCSEEDKESYITKLYNLLNKLIDTHEELSNLITKATYENDLYDLRTYGCKLLIYTEAIGYPDLHSFSTAIINYVNSCRRLWESCISDNFQGKSIYKDQFTKGVTLIDELDRARDGFADADRLVHNENTKNDYYKKECN